MFQFIGSFVFLTQHVHTIESLIAKRGQCLKWHGGGEVTNPPGSRAYFDLGESVSYTVGDEVRHKTDKFPLRLEFVEWLSGMGATFLIQQGTFVGPFHSDCDDDLTKLYMLEDPAQFDDEPESDLHVICPATKEKKILPRNQVPEFGTLQTRDLVLVLNEGEWSKWTEQ